MRTASPSTSTTNNNNNNNNNKGESHRIYWQQWLGPSVNGGAAALPDNGGGGGGVKSRRDLITSSAAVRISPTGARALDVTQLLRKTLNISSLSSLTSNGYNGNGNGNGNGTGNANPDSQVSALMQHQLQQEQDCLVLVGTLYSLPRDYVQFEHEQQQLQQQQQEQQRFTNPQYAQPHQSQQQQQQSQQQQQQQPPLQSQQHSHSDPFHVVRTLRPHDNPAFVRNRMAAHLQKLLDEAASGLVNTTRTIISPKLQWYFVPAATETASPIPNCIDLDGYCTSMEDDEDDDEDKDDDAHDGLDYQDEDDDVDVDDDEKDENDWQTPKDESQSLLLSRFPWLEAAVDSSSAATAATQLPPDTDERHRLAQQQQQQQRLRRVSREERRYQELASSQSALRHYCMSGYLLKRSRRDPHVWRRVHCVLTDDYLWYVSRVYACTDGSNSSDSNHSSSNSSPHAAKGQTPPVAKHGRIRLTRALLLEPAPEYAPLYRTPNAFEVVSARGTSHVFRAASKSLQLKWIQTLSERIVQSYENSLLENAELIVADECLARNRRRTSTAVQPLWDAVCASQDPSSVHTVRVGAILRLGIEVAEYRECCRHVQARMPAKNPVVVTTPRRASPTRSGDVHVQRTLPNAFVASEPMDPVLQDMIRAAWEHTAALLARVTHVALQVQSGPTDHKKPSRSIETQCRHIDYVITGRFRSSRSLNGNELAATDSIDAVSRRLPNGSGGSGSTIGSSSSSNNMNSTFGTNSHEPPPTDLFDSLLTEIQGLVANAAQPPVRVTGSENGTTNGANHHPDHVISTREE
jgi:hypothetical protein